MLARMGLPSPSRSTSQGRLSPVSQQIARRSVSPSSLAETLAATTKVHAVAEPASRSRTPSGESDSAHPTTPTKQRPAVRPSVSAAAASALSKGFGSRTVSTSTAATSKMMTPTGSLHSTPRATPTKRAASPTKLVGTAASKQAKTSAASAVTPTAASGKSAEGAAAVVTAKQNVVVCVRMRPGAPAASAAAPATPTKSASKASAATAAAASPIECWTLDKDTHTITATEQHPALAKRASSSAPLGEASTVDEEGASGSYKFSFDSLTLPSETGDGLYEQHVAPIIRAAAEGYNATVFAYGQTGSGKTHTMSGSPQEKGIIPRAVEEIFAEIERDESREYLLRVSYLEIYNEQLKDLLAALPSSSGKPGSGSGLGERPASPTKGGFSHSSGSSSAISKDGAIRIIEDKGRIVLTGLREEIVTDPATVLQLLEDGQRMRHVGATDWNERSSRSHCVFQITIESTPNACMGMLANGGETRLSQLNLIDLAGSERAASQKARRKEGAFINKSLLTLGTVIAKLTEAVNEDGSVNAGAADQTHIPYRDSKLTRILQTSLGGNARVAVICTLSPDPKHAIETLSTLKFGRRCKMVVTSAKKGSIMDDKALLQKYKAELEALKAQLEGGGASTASPLALAASMGNMSMSMVDEEAEMSMIRDLAEQKEQGQKEVDEMMKEKLQLRTQIEHLTRLILTSKKVAAEGDDTAGSGSIAFDSPATGSPSKSGRRGPRMSELPARSSHLPSFETLQRQRASANGSASTVDVFQHERELAAAKRQASQAESELRAKTLELSQQEARIRTLEADIAANENELDEAEKAFLRLKEERDEAKQQVAEAAQESATLRGALEEERQASQRLQDIADAKVAKAEVEDAVGKLQLEVEQLKREVREAHQVAEEKDLQLQRLELDLEKEKEERERQVAEAQALGAARDRSKDMRLEQLEQDLRKAHGESAAAKSSDLRIEEQRKQIEELQRELEDMRRKEKDAARPLPVPTLGQIRGGGSSSPTTSRIRDSNFWSKAPLTAGGSLPGTPRTGSLRKSPLSPPMEDKRDLFSPPRASLFSSSVGAKDMQRAGSLREYRRYEPADDTLAIPTRASGLSSTAFGPSSAVIDAAVKAEREEISRLNAVISTQRQLMADLERSVAEWKNKLRLQQDLINRLAAEPSRENLASGAVPMPTSPIPEKYHLDSPEKAARLFRESQILASPRPGKQGLGFSTSGSPTKGATLGSTPSSASAAGWFGLVPGQVRPEPLPLHPNSPRRLSGAGSGRRHPRKTLEKEMNGLKASPRVEDIRNRLLDVAPPSPSKLGKADLAAIRSGNSSMRGPKDHYI